MRRILYSYLIFIKEFQSEISEFFGIDSNNKMWDTIRGIVPYHSQTPNFSYNFHGAGCYFERNERICNFDYAPVDDYSIKFSAWDLLEFSRSNVEFSNLNFTEQIVSDELDNLLEQQLLSKMEFGGVIFEKYQVTAKHFEQPELLL